MGCEQNKLLLSLGLIQTPEAKTDEGAAYTPPAAAILFKDGSMEFFRQDEQGCLTQQFKPKTNADGIFNTISATQTALIDMFDAVLEPLEESDKIDKIIDMANNSFGILFEKNNNVNIICAKDKDKKGGEIFGCTLALTILHYLVSIKDLTPEQKNKIDMGKLQSLINYNLGFERFLRKAKADESFLKPLKIRIRRDIFKAAKLFGEEALLKDLITKISDYNKDKKSPAGLLFASVFSIIKKSPHVTDEGVRALRSAMENNTAEDGQFFTAFLDKDKNNLWHLLAKHLHLSTKNGKENAIKMVLGGLNSWNGIFPYHDMLMAKNQQGKMPFQLASGNAKWDLVRYTVSNKYLQLRSAAENAESFTWDDMYLECKYLATSPRSSRKFTYVRDSIEKFREDSDGKPTIMHKLAENGRVDELLEFVDLIKTEFAWSSSHPLFKSLEGNGRLPVDLVEDQAARNKLWRYMINIGMTKTKQHLTNNNHLREEDAIQVVNELVSDSYYDKDMEFYAHQNIFPVIAKAVNQVSKGQGMSLKKWRLKEIYLDLSEYQSSLLKDEADKIIVGLEEVAKNNTENSSFHDVANNITNNTDITALYFAAIRKNTNSRIVEYLQAKNPNLDARIAGETALESAAYYFVNNTECTETFSLVLSHYIAEGRHDALSTKGFGKSPETYYRCETIDELASDSTPLQYLLNKTRGDHESSPNQIASDALYNELRMKKIDEKNVAFFLDQCWESMGPTEYLGAIAHTINVLFSRSPLQYEMLLQLSEKFKEINQSNPNHFPELREHVLMGLSKNKGENADAIRSNLITGGFFANLSEGEFETLIRSGDLQNFLWLANNQHSDRQNDHAQAETFYNLLNKTYENGDTILHLACRKANNGTQIQEIFSLAPWLMFAENSQQQTPFDKLTPAQNAALPAIIHRYLIQGRLGVYNAFKEENFGKEFSNRLAAMLSNEDWIKLQEKDDGFTAENPIPPAVLVPGINPDARPEPSAPPLRPVPSAPPVFDDGNNDDSNAKLAESPPPSAPGDDDNNWIDEETSKSASSPTSSSGPSTATSRPVRHMRRNQSSHTAVAKLKQQNKAMARKLDVVTERLARLENLAVSAGLLDTNEEQRPANRQQA